MGKFIERLDFFMRSEDINDNQLTVNAGLSNGLIGRCRKKGGGMASESIEKILSAYPELSADWLLTGRGIMIRGGFPETAEPTRVEESRIPLIPQEAFAGQGDPAYDDEKDLSYYSIDEFRNSDFLIRIKGDSMWPKFAGGDIVACKKIKDVLFIQWGRVYVLYTQSQGIMIKRLQPAEDNDYITCVSDNERYAPFNVPKSDIVSLALVNGSISVE